MQTLVYLCSHSTLTWHNAIPTSELWVKIGGDKGQGSFKMSLQLVNVPHPNAAQNTSLLFLFKAGDSRSNLHTALQQYQEDICKIQGMKWRYYLFHN